MYVAEVITQPVHTKNDLFSKLERPNTRGDLRMLIEFLDSTASFPPTQFGNYILEKYPVKKSSTRETILKVGDVTDTETLYI